jgi:hypothetical protein
MFSEDTRENYALSVQRRRFVYETVAPIGAAARESVPVRPNSAAMHSQYPPIHALHKAYDEARDRSTMYSRGLEHLEEMAGIPGVLSAFKIGQGTSELMCFCVYVHV